jgi:hypothetical protein
MADEMDFITIYRTVLRTLEDKGFITELDVDYLKSKTRNRDDVDIIMEFLLGAGIIASDSETKTFKVKNRSLLRKILAAIS